MTERPVRFEVSEPAGDPGASRFTAPASAVYGVEKVLPFTAAPSGVVELLMTQTAPRTLFDPEALAGQVGQRIAINGPRQLAGTLLSVDAADDGLSVKLRIETDRG